MDGAEINYRRLLMLIDEAGGVASLSRAVGHKTSSTLSQYKGRAADSKTGKPKRLGRGLVRDLEDACQKEHGWMDQPLNETELIIYGPERYPYEVTARPHVNQEAEQDTSTPDAAPTTEQVSSEHRAECLAAAIRSMLEGAGLEPDRLGTEQELRTKLGDDPPPPDPHRLPHMNNGQTNLRSPKIERG